MYGLVGHMTCTHCLLEVIPHGFQLNDISTSRDLNTSNLLSLVVEAFLSRSLCSRLHLLRSWQLIVLLLLLLIHGHQT